MRVCKSESIRSSAVFDAELVGGRWWISVLRGGGIRVVTNERLTSKRLLDSVSLAGFHVAQPKLNFMLEQSEDISSDNKLLS